MVSKSMRLFFEVQTIQDRFQGQRVEVQTIQDISGRQSQNKILTCPLHMTEQIHGIENSLLTNASQR